MTTYPMKREMSFLLLRYLCVFYEGDETQLILPFSADPRVSCLYINLHEFLNYHQTYHSRHSLYLVKKAKPIPSSGSVLYSATQKPPLPGVSVLTPCHSSYLDHSSHLLCLSYFLSSSIQAIVSPLFYVLEV